MFRLYICTSSLLLIVGIYKIRGSVFFSKRRNEEIKKLHKEQIGDLIKHVKTKKKKLVFILPVYKEQAMINQTCKFYLRILEKNPCTELIIVGTVKEQVNGKNDTLELAKKHTHARLKVIESPNPHGNMATQDNFAVQYLKNQNTDLKNTWIHFLNIDSRIEESYFKEVFYHMNQGHNLMLQSSLFLGNYAQLGSFLQGGALSQTRWTVTGEQLRILENNYCTDKRLYNVVGHGLIINATTFLDLQGFPENTFNEDLHFGFYASMLGKKCYSLASYEIADVPTNIKEWYMQAEGRFIGAFEYGKYYKTYLLKFSQNIDYKGLLMTAQGYASAIRWICISYMVLFILGYSILHKEHLIFSLLIIGLYFSQYRIVISMLDKQGKNSENKHIALLKCFVYICFRSFPATTGLIKYILHITGIRSLRKYKTSHE